MPRKVTPTYVLLNQITLAAASSSVDFSNIPQNYGDLVMVVNASTTSGGAVVFARFNSDSGSNYSAVFMDANGSSASSGTSSGTQARMGVTYSTRGVNTFHFQDYSAVDKHKTILTRFLNPANVLGANAVRWASTSSILSISYYPESTTFTVGSTFSLYGIVA
jgi:hypothetical protein